MSTNEIMHRISQGGEKGVRKTELKKEFQHTSIDDGNWGHSRVGKIR